MRQHPIVAATILAAGVLAGASLAKAGIIITATSKNRDTGKVTHPTLYIDGNRLAIRVDGGTGMIFDGDSQTTWNYDIPHKYYFKMTGSDAKALAVKTQRMADAAMKSELAGMSPEMRKKVKAEMQKEAEQAKKGPHYRRTGTDRTVGKWNCTPVARFSANGEKQESMCIASYEALGISPDDLKVLDSLDRFVAQMGSSNDSGSGHLTPAAEKQLGLSGYPVEDDDGTLVSTVTAVRHGAVPAKVFQLPSGLHERKMLGD